MEEITCQREMRMKMIIRDGLRWIYLATKGSALQLFLHLQGGGGWRIALEGQRRRGLHLLGSLRVSRREDIGDNRFEMHVW
jgi:hypothetical protein